MDLKTKIYLVNTENEKFMGIGVVWLLEEIKKQSSLRAAANEIGISYSKAYSMMSMLEDSLGKVILVRRRGGYSRQGAYLTDFGEEFLKQYKSFHDEIKEVTKIPYQKFNKDLNSLLNEYDKEGNKI
ncbi:MAG: LysR family transcriptional regulator [Spirochaetia bacterium]|nr:LysR family transcriptional regulator [Spirochaetia bacterium]